MITSQVDQRNGARSTFNAILDVSRDPNLMRRLAAIRNVVEGRIVFTTSFGIEDQAIGHAIFAQGLDIEVVTLDTGRLFPETYELWTRTERRYGRRILALCPDRLGIEALVARQGINGFFASVEARRACCAIRKVEPLGRALAGAAAWITGLRANQSEDRAETSLAVMDPKRRLFKVSPLFDWTREEVLSFIREHQVPHSSLHDRGFASIGCAPCTRPITPGEPERAGRWWWEQNEKKECGLHLPRDARAPMPARRENTAQDATSWIQHSRAARRSGLRSS
jgi:phosphoadenosine phosphosulfate reductase